MPQIETPPANVEIAGRDEDEIDGQIFHLPSYLKARARRAYRQSKRVRTRLSLVAATAAQMDSVGYERLTIEGIVEDAHLARGTFYLYFANRSEAAMAVRRAFVAMMRIRRPRSSRKVSRYKSILRVNRFYVACYKRNARLLQGQEALMHDRPELSHSRDFLNHRWAKVILRDVARANGLHAEDFLQPRSLIAARAAIAMADELLRETFVNDNPLLMGIAQNDDEIAEVMSILWYRALYGHHPPDAPALLG
jgi:AcrR family transcriptional regulator